ncbi:UNVERIFIED_CONTAM: hypothetical protein Slati_4594800 [Sesamum latifolium]|uniref:RNase H type-1 domain-containing protein n=1 Tax=Sesamum latifolium TaxID=2727402 RepID=A0AAW2S2D1_9LAMI
MRMAHEAGARRLLAYSDSQLIVNQIEGTFEAKEEKARSLLAIQPITTRVDWRTPITKWIEEGHLPDDRWEAARLKTRATRFLVQAGTLYKKSYMHPLLRCLSIKEGARVLQEIHSGCCGAHAGTWTLANKALRAGYF